MADLFPLPPEALRLLGQLKDEDFIRLRLDVPNPNPDRRVRHDWTKRPVWAAGTILAVWRTIEPVLNGRVLTRVRLHNPRAGGYLSMVLEQPDEVDGHAIVQILLLAEAHTPTITDMMHECGFGGTTVLEALQQMKKITVQDVAAAIARVLASPEA